jgi:hypothetical protein
MGFLCLGPGAEARIDRKDNENYQGDYGPVEPKDADDQIKSGDTGDHRDEPNNENKKFTINVSIHW